MNVFLLMILSLLGGKESDEVRDNCRSFKATYDTEVLGNKITVSVHATGGKEPYYYFFFDKKDNPLTWDFKVSNCIVEKSALPKFVKVLDSDGCATRIDINETIER
ncbi:MAG TPA: hypothetical protein VK658_00725 [Chryseolinea sp.]|nr:hypothetical protein [Chryseolinea sp.]